MKSIYFKDLSIGQEFIFVYEYDWAVKLINSKRTSLGLSNLCTYIKTGPNTYTNGDLLVSLSKKRPARRETQRGIVLETAYVLDMGTYYHANQNIGEKI